MPLRALPTAKGDAIARLTEIILDMDPVELRALLATLDDASRMIVERILADITRMGWRSSPLDMAMHFDPTIRDYPYTRLLSDKFVDAVTLRSPRQVWNLPARYGKSTIASRWGPVYALDRDPTAGLILTSYGDTLVDEHARFVRDTLVLHGDVLATRLRRDRRRSDRFVTEQGGGLIAAGVGAGLIGFGGSGGVVDDPFKNWQAAHSEAERKRVWDWFRSVFYLRFDEIQLAWIIIVMTRWHEEDLTGMVEEAAKTGDGDEYEIVRFPAIADHDPSKGESDALGRKPGEVLEPRRFPIEAVLQRARNLGSYLAAGLEQQQPTPEEGTDIMRAWWKWFERDAEPKRFDNALTSWDMKLKDKEQGDFVVGQLWYRIGPDYWLIDTLRGQWNQATTRVAIALMAVRHPDVGRHVVENTGYGPEVMAELRKASPEYVLRDETIGALGITEDEVPKVEALLRRGMTGLLPENPKGDKRVRMRAYTGLIEGGNVHVPVDGKGEALVNEASAFPNGAHDDQVDAMSQAFKRMSGGTGSVQRPKGQVRTPDPSARATPKRRAGGAQVLRPQSRRRPPRNA